jgi:ABC-2 type transport system ATP-binding protein
MISTHSPPDRSAPLLRVEGLTKRYDGDGPAIDGVAFSVVEGEVVGVIGPNGAGKTTLLETIVGLLSLDSGRIFWREAPLAASRRHEELFYLPDGVRPYRDQLTVHVVSFFAGVHGRSEADVEAAVAAVGLRSVLRKRVHALSKGYNRRLMLALGLLAPHSLLLMDEPFDGFDLRQTRDVMTILRDQAARGRTLILAIHQLGDAQQVCDRFVLLAAGQVRGFGTLEELRARTGLQNASLENIFLALT